ncbi:MAG: fructose-6-phosphate aldolase [Myxococcota bacterium]
MKIFLDTANIDEIREIHAWGILDGVTTNPSLIAKNGGDFIQTIYDICELVQGPVSAEVVAQDTQGMLREGRLLAKVHEHVVVKVPMSPAGLGCVRALTDEGIRTNVTLCFQPVQALLAAKAGATYISPFVGRVDDIGWGGDDLVDQIVAVYDNYPDLKTQVLAASIRHPAHMVAAALAGAHVATVPYGVMKKLLNHPLTESGNTRFLAEWATGGDADIGAQVERWLAAG